MKFTLIWMTPDLTIGCEVYGGTDLEDALRRWREDTVDCDLIGVIAGDPEILRWYP